MIKMEAVRNGKAVTFEIDEKGCHVCTSHSGNGFGYPQVMVGGKREYMHRFFYVRKYGEIQDGLILRHKCDNPACINEEHFETGTQADNMRDRAERGRVSYNPLRGSSNGNSILSEKEVIEIKTRLKNGVRKEQLAVDFNVSFGTITSIKSGARWAHIVI